MGGGVQPNYPSLDQPLHFNEAKNKNADKFHDNVYH